jgi:hypothetical protein
MTIKRLLSPSVLLLLLLFNPVKSWGQNIPIPDCTVFFNITLAAQTTVATPTTPTVGGVGDNRTNGCQSYLLQYQTNGTGALSSVSFQAGKSNTTTVTFANWAGTVLTGINPNTSSTGAISTFNTGCANSAACTVADSWIRVLVTRGTFSGTISGVLYGYKSGYPGGGSSTVTACPGTAAVPCVVDGPTAAGSAPTKPPVLVAGQDGAPGAIRTIKTDASGQEIPANASFVGADGISNTENSPAGAGGVQLFPRIIPYIYNGTTNDRQFDCIFQAVAVVAPGTTGVLITGTAAKTTKICHMHMSTTATGSTLTITSGTGSTCGTGTATIDAYVAGVTAFAMDYTPLSPLKAAVAADDVCYTFSPGGITADITVIYAKI